MNERLIISLAERLYDSDLFDRVCSEIKTLEAERDRLKAVNAEMLEALKRAAPWLGKLIADEVHLKCVNPSDALRTLAMVQIVIGKAEGQ